MNTGAVVYVVAVQPQRQDSDRRHIFIDRRGERGKHRQAQHQRDPGYELQPWRCRRYWLCQRYNRSGR